MPRTADLDGLIAEVVEENNCSGCGFCVRLSSGLRMTLNDAGFLRPQRQYPSESVPSSVDVFNASCPGKVVRSRQAEGSERHATLGSHVGVWQAWSVDAGLRHVGSSGGVITALTTWLLSTGEAHEVVGAGKQPDDPRRSVSVRITSREEAERAAGSRYAPVANAALVAGPSSAFVGKPCEVAAVRAGDDAMQSVDPPLLISFFCAGTPSQTATEGLLESLGVKRGTPLRDLWYRGRGWPGMFTAVAADGATVSTSYDNSWGRHLGKDVQWRCKICPDGVGESADIVAADYWNTDDKGYPLFTEGAGKSALIARTHRGREVLDRAVLAGILHIESLGLEELARVQPLQVDRRRLLLGRLVGARVGGRRIPRFRGFRLLRLASLSPRLTIRTARATFGRVRAMGRAPR